MAKPRSEYVIQTVANALRVLEAFDGREEVGVTELSRELGLHKNNVFRLLATLQEKSYVEQSQTDRYRLGLRCLELGQSFVRSRRLLRQARPVLEALSRETGESVHLAVLDGFEVVFVDGEQSSRLLGGMVRIGMQIPAHCTAAGKVLLGCASEPVRVAYDRDVVSGRKLESRTPRTLSDREKLFDELRAVASRGFALDLEECEPGLCCVAAPVYDAASCVVAALSISGPAARLDEDALVSRLAPAVVAAAGSISHMLGHS
jgi:DNA-binding IclR family transcriptional regulator